ncbi:MAG: electron transfer flavoprotein subunit beta [Fibrobacteria bacterium]|nr:electron transfer flavoprotein subunit beta [Fibrobacteria bacterium]
MSNGYDIVVCGSLVPDPLQTLEPIMGPQGPGLKNEMMLPAVLDPWAGHALYEADHLAKKTEGSRVFLVSIGPKAKLQQLMMAIGQKASFELIVKDGPASGFTDAADTARVLAEAIESIPGLDKSKLLVFGGCASASRDAGVTMQMVGEKLGITDHFLAVDALEISDSGSLKIKERAESGQYLLSECSAPPALIAWATGNLPEPPNNPQIGMANMRKIMPALQQAGPAGIESAGLSFAEVTIPQQKRDTKIEKDMPVDDIAREIVEWIKG